jgi:hypothetical protein
MSAPRATSTSAVSQPAATSSSLSTEHQEVSAGHRGRCIARPAHPRSAQSVDHAQTRNPIAPTTSDLRTRVRRAVVGDDLPSTAVVLTHQALVLVLERACRVPRGTITLTKHGPPRRDLLPRSSRPPCRGGIYSDARAAFSDGCSSPQEADQFTEKLCLVASKPEGVAFMPYGFCIVMGSRFAKPPSGELLASEPAKLTVPKFANGSTPPLEGASRITSADERFAD